jgi:integrase
VSDDILHEGTAVTIQRPGAPEVTRHGHARTAAASARRPRGVGRVYRPEYRDKKTGERRTVATWWIQYSHNGKPLREPSHSTSRADAVRLLKKRLGEIGRGQLIGPKEEKLTFEDLAVDLVRDYVLHERCSADTLGGALLPDRRLDLEKLGGRLRHLYDVFGRDRALDITTDRMRAYQDRRRDAGASAATVNRELAALGRMFTLAVKAGRLGTRPPFPERLQEAPPRQGFFEVEEHDTISGHLPPDHQDMQGFSYWSGWRPGAIHELEWPEIDLDAQIIRPRGGSRTKRRGVLAYGKIPALRVIMERRLAKRRLDTPLVFHVDGRPLGDWRKRWARACLRAGFASQDPETKTITVHKLRYDTRRTVVRNLTRAGVPERVAMEITGHKTRSVFDRYNIVSERDLQDAGASLAAYVAQQPTPARTVVPLRSAAAGEAPSS